jgi:hypothetical protein
LRYIVFSIPVSSHSRQNRFHPLTQKEYVMHPEIAKVLIAQRHDELVHDTASRRRGAGRPTHGRHLFPRWHVSWTRTTLVPAGPPAAAGTGRSSRAGHRGSSLVIIISAHRSA